MIYFIRDNDSGHIKIGVSRDPIKRTEGLSESTGRGNLELLGAISGGKLSERKLHKKFVHLNVPRVGKNGRPYKTEWFLPGPELIEFATQHMKSVPEVLEEGATIQFQVDDYFMMQTEQAAIYERIPLEELTEHSIAHYCRAHIRCIYPFTDTQYTKPRRRY